MTLKTDAKFLENTKHSKAQNVWLFLSKVREVWAKKYRAVIFHDMASDANLNKLWPCGFKNGMRNWVNFH